MSVSRVSQIDRESVELEVDGKKLRMRFEEMVHVQALLELPGLVSQIPQHYRDTPAQYAAISEARALINAHILDWHVGRRERRRSKTKYESAATIEKLKVVLALSPALVTVAMFHLEQLA